VGAVGSGDWVEDSLLVPPEGQTTILEFHGTKINTADDLSSAVCRLRAVDSTVGLKVSVLNTIGATTTYRLRLRC
jgi:hypothetical protein